MLDDLTHSDDDLQTNTNGRNFSEGCVETLDSSPQVDKGVDDGRRQSDTSDVEHDEEKNQTNDENVEMTEEIIHSQAEKNSNDDVRYSHPDIVLRKEATFLSYHDSDSDLVDYSLDTGSLFPAINLDKSDADSWDWTFHDENVSDIDVKVVTTIPRKKSSLLSNISENFYIRTPEVPSNIESQKQPPDDKHPRQNANSITETNKQIITTNISKESLKNEMAQKSCLLPERKLRNTAVSFSAPRNISNRSIDEQNKNGWFDFNKYQPNIVYFEDLRTSQIYRTRLKYLGINCTVESQLFLNEENQTTRNDKTNKRKCFEETIQLGFKHGRLSNLGNVYKKLTKLEEMFTLSSRHVRSIEPAKENVNVEKGSFTSPLSMSLSRSEFNLPQIVDNKAGPTTGQNHSITAQHPGRLIGRKLIKDRSMSRSNMFAKSLSKEEVQKTLDDQQGSSTHLQHLSGLGKFRYLARMVLILLRAMGLKPKKPETVQYNFLSWGVMPSGGQGLSRLNYNNGALTFNPLMYKANKEATLSQETKNILRLPPSQRTEAHVHTVVVNLHNVVQSFSEFPKRIQQSMVKVCMYERFEAGRVIIRQGHRAENFYFILSGNAVVTKMESGANNVHTLSVLSKGNSFGELAFLHMSKRAATVSCIENVELISIERNDYIDIFMRPSKGQEPDHITFLKGLDLLQGWPFHVLPHDNPKICAFTYVRRDVILCQNNSKSEWIFVVFSGTCKVLAALDDGPIKRRKEIFRLPDINKIPKTSYSIDFSKLCTNSSTEDSSQNKKEDNEVLSDDETVEADEHKGNVVGDESPQREDNLQDRENEDTENQQLPDHLSTIQETNNEDNQDHVHDSTPAINGNDSSSDVNGEEENLSESEPYETITDLKMVVPENVLSVNDDGQVQDTKTNQSLPKRVSFQPAEHHTESVVLKQKQSNDATTSALQAKGPGTSLTEQQRTVGKTTFAEIARLESGDVFGMEQVVLAGMRDVVSCSLISEGAEMILISRSFFKKHLTEDTMKRIRLTIRPLPSQKSLQKKFETKKLWDVYKSETMAKQKHESIRLTAKLRVV